MSRYFIITLLVIGSLIGLACASGAPTSPSATPDVTGQLATPGNHVSWGVYDLVLDARKGTVELAANRTADGHMNVTSKVKPPICFDCVILKNISYDPETKRFGVDIQLKNPTNLTGNDVRGVISDPGGNKYLSNPDGITTFWGPPLQYKAFNTEGDRKFTGMAIHTRTFEFFLPAGENFKTLTYIVDASVPGPVEEPLAEMGTSDPVVNNDFTTTFLRTTVFDHQGDLASVSCDLMPLGGNPSVPMFDDGAHNDGAAGDHIYGITGVKTSMPVGLYMINVYPLDGAGHMGWGQIPVSVQKTTGGDNHDPEITGVTSDRTTADGAANEKIKITVTAKDVDGDTLSYQFEGTGTFTGNSGGSVNWKPSSSNTGGQTISIKVLDPKGGEADSSIKLWSTKFPVLNNSSAPGNLIISQNLPEAFGGNVDPASFKFPGVKPAGKVVYMNFFATWCGPCMAEMPELTKIYNEYKDNEDYVHLLIDDGEPQGTVENWISSNSYACSHFLMDLTGSYYGSSVNWTDNPGYIPTHLVFDRDGHCRGQIVGGIQSSSDLTKYFDELL